MRLVLLLCLIVGAAGGVLELLNPALQCPWKLAKCLASKDCREILQCAGKCLGPDSKLLNLTCYVPACTFDRDQTRWLEFSDCIASYSSPDQPQEEDIPHNGSCATPERLVDTSFEMSMLEGEWYVVAGASTLDYYDCQANRVSRLNHTAWQIDEYFQGNITGFGPTWARSRQIIHPLSPGRMDWGPAAGAAGYEAEYSVLKAGKKAEYVILFYCAPLKPTIYSWSSFITYARKPQMPAQAEKLMRSYMKKVNWDYPLRIINHQDCDYKIAPLRNEGVKPDIGARDTGALSMQ